MAKFKVGDRVEAHTDFTSGMDAVSVRGQIGTVVKVLDGFYYDMEDYGRHYQVNFPGWSHWNIGENNLKAVDQPTKESKSIMTNLVKRVKDLTLSKDDKVLRSQGFVNADGEVTDDGARVLREYLFNENKDAMVKIAQQLEAEDKAAKK